MMSNAHEEVNTARPLMHGWSAAGIFGAHCNHITLRTLGCCAQLHSLLGFMRSGMVSTQLCLANAQLALSRLDEAGDTLGEAEKAHAQLCQGTGVALPDVPGMGGETATQAATSGDSVPAPADSTGGACAPSSPLVLLLHMHAGQEEGEHAVGRPAVRALRCG